MFFSLDVTRDDVYLPFIPTNVTYGVEERVLDESDGGTSDAITIPIGFPFGESLQNQFYVMPTMYLAEKTINVLFLV